MNFYLLTLPTVYRNSAVCLLQGCVIHIFTHCVFVYKTEYNDESRRRRRQEVENRDDPELRQRRQRGQESPRCTRTHRPSLCLPTTLVMQSFPFKIVRYGARHFHQTCRVKLRKQSNSSPTNSTFSIEQVKSQF